MIYTLQFGSLSCRLFFKKLEDVYRQVKGHSQPPMSLMGQVRILNIYMKCLISEILSVTMERILLHSIIRNAKFWQDGRKSCLSPDSLALERRSEYSKEWDCWKKSFSLVKRSNWVSLDWRHHDPAPKRRLDTSSGPSLCRLFPDPWRFIH